ncbi:MAG: YopX family protein [Eubacterium sp.]|nr:YopX family protein [Eubacterium sp.]
MREILFRGKRADNGAWVQGLPSGSISAIEFYDGLTDCETAEVISETVGQYTGLTDKNGKRIFEGDIVISTSPNRLTNKPMLVRFSPLSGYSFCELERQPLIVGNIHDNPELLKEKK